MKFYKQFFFIHLLLLVFLNITLNGQEFEATQSDFSAGYEEEVGDNGFEFEYEFTSEPGTYILQHVTAHIIYRCDGDVVMEREVDYYEWFLTGSDGKTIPDVHEWNSITPDVLLSYLSANNCPREDCDPMTAEITQSFEIGVADFDPEDPPEAFDEDPSNGSQFGYLEGGTDIITLKNCNDQDISGENPDSPEHVQGTAPPYGIGPGFSFRSGPHIEGVTHSTTTTFNGNNVSAEPGNGHSNEEGYENLGYNFTEADADEENDRTIFRKLDLVKPEMVPWIARGTGETTGHVGDLVVPNDQNKGYTVAPQTVFIPSDGQFQSYVVQIPETYIEANETTIIPVEGYCTQVTLPPVPSGTAMTTTENWVTVNDPSRELDEGTIILVNENVVSPFDPSKIEDYINADGYNPTGDSAGSGPQVTWPRTENPIRGTINVNKNPELFGPIVIEIVDLIEEAAEVIQNDPDYTTPFSGNPEKEKESIIQHATWITMGKLTGDPYEKEDFRDNVYEQFENNSGTSISDLSDGQKEDLDSGVEDFWNTFQATGVEAKVLGSQGDESYKENEEDDPKCMCDALAFRVTIRQNSETSQFHVRSDQLGDELTPLRTNIDLFAGDTFVVELDSIHLECNCPDPTVEGQGETDLCDSIYKNRNINDHNYFNLRRRLRVGFASNGRHENRGGRHYIYPFKVAQTIGQGDEIKWRFYLSAYCTEDGALCGGDRSKIDNFSDECIEGFEIYFNAMDKGKSIKLEKNLSKEYIEDSYGAIDPSISEYSNSNLLFNVNQDQFYLMLQEKEKKTWLKLDKKKWSWRKPTPNEMLKEATLICGLSSVQGCPGPICTVLYGPPHHCVPADTQQ